MNKPFLRLVAEDIQQRFGSDLSDIAIIFNNKRPITYLKKHLADVYGRALWSPHFFTIQEFFKLSTDAVEVSPLTQFFYLFELHNELLAAEGAEPESLEEFYPVAEIILSDFGQLDYELVDIEHIYMELYDTTKIDIAFQHLTVEQQHFIRQFWQSFSLAGHTGLQQRFLRLWKRLPVLYKRFKTKLQQAGQLNYPTLYRDIVEGAVPYPDFEKRYKKILFVGFNALNKAEAHLFKKWQEEDRALFYFDVDAYYLNDPQQEAGLFIRRNLQQYQLENALGEPPNMIGHRNSEVHLYASTGKNSQAKLLHNVLLQHRAEGKSAAILLADESMLVPLLQSLPDLKPNITTGYPLIQSPIYGLIDLWMRTHEEISHKKKKKVAFQQLEAFINHPLTHVSPSEKTALLDEISTKQLFEVDIEAIALHSSVFPRFFKPLASPTELIPTLINLLDSLLSSIATEDRVRQIDSNLIVETKKVLNQLKLGIDRIRRTSIAFQIGLIRKAIHPVNSAIEGDPLRGVQIMGLLESRCLNFDYIYILGANEGILPQTSSSPTFLPNSLRRAYDLPVLENQDALSAYLFYRHFQFSEGIHLFYNSIVDESSTGEESRFIKQLRFESSFRFIVHTQQQPVRFPDPCPELIIPKSGKIKEHLWNTYIVGKKKLSATAFTTYLQSPLQFFLKHVADIKEPPSISHEFEMNRLGTVIHNVMEKLLKPYKGLEHFTSTKQLSEKLAEVDALITEEIGNQYHTAMTSLADLNSMQRIMHKIASEYVRMYLTHDMQHFKAFRIIELENDEDYTLDFPISVDGSEQTVRLFGIIDRVDEVVTHHDEIKTRIVDYKTGGDSVLFKSLEKVLAPNTENKALIQTLFYAYVFEQVTGRRQLEPNLYVARKMREEGTLFSNGKDVIIAGEQLIYTQDAFVRCLRDTLQEIFDPAVPFRHNPDSKIYPSDPYTLFYRDAVPQVDQE